jgi:hypothetical protein
MENYFEEIFVQELSKLKDEISKFNNDTDVWRVTDGITNPAGVLTKHLLGNLNHTIGATMGKNGYVRNRDYEFAVSAENREELVDQIEKTIEVVKTTLGGLTQTDLNEKYPLEMFGQKSTAFYLTYFYGHFKYHLGQINYLRRILENL